MKYTKLIITIMVFTGTVSAASFELRDSCNSDEEPMLSMYSEDGGNAGMPGFYNNQICADDLSEAGFYQSCPDDMNEVVSFYKKNDSHVSTFSSYNWKLCATDIQASINNSCSSDNIIASLKSKDDSHIASPNHYSNKLCAEVQSPETVSLEIETKTDEVFIDGESAEEREYSPLEVSYPYIVSDQPLGIVSYGDLVSLEYSNKTDRDIFRVTQRDGSFLVPSTQGRYPEVESEEDYILDRSFLEFVEPNFGFKKVQNPILRISLDPETKIKGFENRENGRIELFVRNTYGNESTLKIGPVQ